MKKTAMVFTAEGYDAAMDAGMQYADSRLYAVVTDLGGVIKYGFDMETECKTAKTAVRRFLKTLADIAPVCYAEAAAEMEYAALGKFDGPSSVSVDGYSYGIECLDNGQWYVYLNICRPDFRDEKLDLAAGIVSENAALIVSESKFSAAAAVIVSDGMTAKMAGFPSVSTNCLENPVCQKRMQDGASICAHCFAATNEKLYAGLRANTTYNYRLLNSGDVIPGALMPHFNHDVNMCRIESFGDLASWQQAASYINMVSENPHVNFAWWTKNPAFIAQAIKNGYPVPENVEIIYSSPELNNCVPFETIHAIFPFINKTFTVYDKATIAERGIDINCGARSCKNCHRCYYGHKDCHVVSEMLK